MPPNTLGVKPPEYNWQYRNRVNVPRDSMSKCLNPNPGTQTMRGQYYSGSIHLFEVALCNWKFPQKLASSLYKSSPSSSNGRVVPQKPQH